MSVEHTVLINDLSLFRQRTGIASYVAQLLEHLPEAIDGVRVVRLSETLWGAPLRRVMLAYRASASKGKETGAGAKAARAILGAGRRFGHSALDRYLGAASSLSRWGLYHEPDTIPLVRGSPTVTTVHDLSVLLFPHWHPRHRVLHYERRLRLAAERTSLFIAVSESTKRDLVAHVGVPAADIRVIPEAPRPQFRAVAPERVMEARRRYRLPERYFLYIGTLEPRKNVEGLLDAHAGLPRPLRERFPLVLAGGWGWKHEKVRQKLHRTSHVGHLGYVADDDLVALCNGAYGVVYPSFYEGFGLPPLEAMACGVPVITSHGGALAETAGEAAIVVEPTDIASLRKAMETLALEPEMAREYRKRGLTHVARYSWDETARRTLEVYRELLRRN